MKKSTVTKLDKFIKDESVFWGKVTKLGRKNVNGELEAFMELSMPKTAGLGEFVKVQIMDSDADTEENHGSLVRMLNREVPFVLIRVEDDVAYGSRKIAQEKLKADMLQDLVNGNPFSGTIVSFAPYGAYVEVNGVTGLLRNSEATKDHSELSEHFKTGDTITVKCNDVTPDGRINWTCPTKLSRKAPIELDFEEGMIISGTVISITNFGNSSGVGVFVRVSKGVDALCGMPDFEVYQRQEVAVKIVRITQDPSDPNGTPKIRGKIIRVL